MPRDQAFERELAENLQREAARQFGIDIEPLLNQMWARLERGDEIFDDAHKIRPNLPEALEELTDGLAYMIFDCEVNRGSDDYEDAPDLFRAMLGLAQVDALVRGIKQRRRERLS